MLVPMDRFGLTLHTRLKHQAGDTVWRWAYFSRHYLWRLRRAREWKQNWQVLETFFPTSTGYWRLLVFSAEGNILPAGLNGTTHYMSENFEITGERPEYTEDIRDNEPEDHITGGKSATHDQGQTITLKHWQVHLIRSTSSNQLSFRFLTMYNPEGDEGERTKIF